MISQEINITPAIVRDRQAAVDEYSRRCDGVALAEKRLTVFKRDYPDRDASSFEAAAQRAREYAQEAWEVVVNYLR